MTNQITRDELLDLIFVEKGIDGGWYISGVKTDVYGKVQGDVYGDIGGGVFGNIEYSVIGDVGGNVTGDVRGNVFGDVRGNVFGDVGGNVTGDVRGNVFGDVDGTINGREWNFVETPKEKLQRLVKEGATKEALLAAIDQLEGN